MRAANNADDIITAATGWARDGKLVHPRTDNFVDFVHVTVLIQAGENQYQADTVVGVTSAGEYVFYDVADMQPTSFAQKEASPTTASGTEAVSDIQGDVSADIIRENAQEVNTQAEELSDAGVRYSIREEDRLSMVNSIEGARFSIDEDGYMDALVGDYQKRQDRQMERMAQAAMPKAELAGDPVEGTERFESLMEQLPPEEAKIARMVFKAAPSIEPRTDTYKQSVSHDRKSIPLSKHNN